MEHKDENIPGSNALIMLFLLGFPFLNMSEVHDGEAGAQENQEQVQELAPGLSQISREALLFLWNHGVCGRLLRHKTFR